MESNETKIKGAHLAFYPSVLYTAEELNRYFSFL